jgi:predicted phage terminase large subunit-like protein
VLRRRIRRSLTDWASLALADEGHTPARHHKLLIAALEDVAAGSCDRLMVLMPPGAAKSTYASVLFPAWWFTQHPTSSIIAASHTAELAEYFGRRVRNLINVHDKRLGFRLAADNRAAGRWQVRAPDGTPNGGVANGGARGEYFAAGVRGPITGRRADLAIIDDPVKSQAEADSPAFREHCWNWYRAELSTRLKPGGRIVLIMTRWHEDDLGGRLLAQQADEWRCLRLPALAEANDPLGREPGEPLWPEWEDCAAIERKRATVGTRAFAALFQQNPRPLEGALFRAERIPILDPPPLTKDSGRVVRAWDLAATPKRPGNDPDWTVGLLLLRDEAGRFIVLDIVRLRGSPLEVEQAITATARADGETVPISLPRDPGQAPEFQARHFAGLLAGYRFTITPERGAKLSRATPVAAQAEAGNLALARGGWNHAFLDELRNFPNTNHDDQIDALSRAFAHLISERAGSVRRVTIPFMAR